MLVGPQEYSYLQFDVSSIPGGATVSSASLRLCRTDSAGGARIHELRPITSGWTESGLTWSIAPTAASSYDASMSVPSSVGCVTADVTTDVQAWVAGAGNWGWRIADTNPSPPPPQVDWATREDPSSSQRPSLSVTYTP
jgi:hypothetical protein